MVLSALTILSVMLTEFQQETSAELGSAMSERDAVQAEYAAKSAIALTRLVIAAEPTMRQGLGFLLAAMGMGQVQIPVWEHAELLLSVFNDKSSVDSFGSMLNSNLSSTKGLGLPGTRFEIAIVDEDSKLNFNYAARGTVPASMVVTNQFLSLVRGTQYDKLFEGRDADGNFRDRRITCSAIVDWVDPNIEADPCTPEIAMAAQTSTEDSFYEGLKQPYHRKNAAFDSLEELHLVRGIDDEFWNTFVDPDPDNPKKRIVTVWGSDKVNVNTANGFTLVTLICQFAQGSAACTDPVMRSKIVSVIEMVRGMVPGVPIFKSPDNFVKELHAAELSPNAATNTGANSNPNSKGGNVGGSSGGGMLSMMLQTMGVPPIQLNEALLKERVKVKSDIFSIYAKGVVKSGRRETTTRIHAVVDFRGAPAPGQNRQLTDMAMMSGGTLGALPTAAPTASATVSVPPGVDPSLVTPESILAALQASAGGHIIYYRIN
jgi:general secretion pathway protein K